MGLDDLVPGNTQRARATAVKAFGRFLSVECVDLNYVKGCILHDASGQCFVSTMDKFGMYLALNEGKAGKPLARHSCMQYYRQAKHWLLDQFPQHRAALEGKLLKMGRTLESFCVKREGGGFVKKATACTKIDLKRMMYHLYTNASAQSDYQDAALLSLLWYMFGRASDLTHVRKQNVALDAGGVLFLRLIRMKTCEEQGLSLFPDDDWVTCPIHALALALITQVAPCADLLDHLPGYRPVPTSALATDALANDTPLLELLDDPTTASTRSTNTSAAGAAAAPTIHNHVNRLLDRISALAGVTESLSSHSFRRGGAQHANGSAQLTARWIFDRGAWNVSSTNKAFNYVFNTVSEDHKVAKVLSGKGPDERVRLADLAAVDTGTLEKIAAVQALLFATCRSMNATKYNISQPVLDVLTAYLILHYPLLKAAASCSVAVLRIEQCVLRAGSSLADLLAWSSHLRATQDACTHTARPTNTPAAETKKQRTIQHQASVIDRLIDLAKRQDERLDELEAKINNSARSTTKRKSRENNDVSEQPTKRANTRMQSLVTHLHSVWYEWYAREPPLWSAVAERQKKSDSKQIVGYMKLFADGGFVLEPTAASYRDDVMRVGVLAEAAVLAFLDARAIKSKGASAVLKHMRKLHSAGELNEPITRYRRLLVAGAIRDPAPPHTHDIFEPVQQSQ